MEQEYLVAVKSSSVKEFEIQARVIIKQVPFPISSEIEITDENGWPVNSYIYKFKLTGNQFKSIKKLDGVLFCLKNEDIASIPFNHDFAKTHDWTLQK